MTTARITVDGKEVFTTAGLTILEACRRAGIRIPTICHDNQLEPIGTCQVCVVELEGLGLVSSCATRVADGMVIRTNNPRIASSRRRTVENLLAEHCGDCIAPCQKACPAAVDVQGYLTLIAKGAYTEATELIKETLPLPGVIGRICPRPCEKACRRNLVDEPLAICALKRFAADHATQQGKAVRRDAVLRNNFKVAIVGSGPAGLSCAYYLAQKGHQVVVFEALSKPGGMLRYGIPDHRLPKDILDCEISMITDAGVEIRTGRALGRDFTLDSLAEDGFDAVFLAIGAHESQKMKIVGEDLEGVLPGIVFLRSVASGEKVLPGRKVAVVGGGNTAVDAARTAVRLGAEEVTIVYRRSRAEMLATEWEIAEAEEEGVKIQFLAAPVKILGTGGKVRAVECVKMILCEPDASGRCRPEPIPGSEFTIPVDMVIVAVGQRPDLFCVRNEKMLRMERGNLAVDSATMSTGRKGVFAGGDCVTGAATAVEAIAAGRKAAAHIDWYLRGEPSKVERAMFEISKGGLEALADREEFAKVEKSPRHEMAKLSPTERRTNFREVELGFQEQAALAEARRCLECGCKAVDDCVLRELATEFSIPSISEPRNWFYPLDKAHPFIERDPNKCVACARCARICQEVQGIGALAVSNRVGTIEGYGGPLLNTPCVSCGQCVTSCPVGALVPKSAQRPERVVRTICPYCGVGCGLQLGIRGGMIVCVEGDQGNPVNRGNLCVKGRFGHDFVGHPDRLRMPLVRKDSKLVETSWEEALDLVARRLAEYKGDSFALVSSARCTNEDNYVIQKFVRAVMRTNNIDHCARLCHAPSVAGLAQTLGSGAMTNSIKDIAGAACILAIGTNTTSAHPVIGIEVVKAMRSGSKLIVANPRRIDLCRFADLWLQHRPGTDVALLMGMIRVIVDEGLQDSSFIERRCENFDALKESLRSFGLESVERITGVPRGKIAEAARLYATCKPASVLYAMGITQHSHGTDNVLAISNLALLTGNIGKPLGGVNPLRGQNNVQGSCDMGALPDLYPGYQRVDSPDARSKFEAAYGRGMSHSPGLTLTEMIEAAHAGRVKAMYVIGENLVLSEAFAKHAEEALEKLEFLVVQDMFLTETARLADVVLPAASYAEKDGTFTNTERRVQRVRKALEPPGGARPDWLIMCELSKLMGAWGFDFAGPEDVMDEINKLVPIYGGIGYERLEHYGLQWPCPSKEHPGTPILHMEKFPTASGRGKFMPLVFKPSAELPDKEYPLMLTTERSLYHYHTGTMTRRVPGLNVLRARELVEMNPRDAATLGISDGERVRVVSRRGDVTATAKVTNDSPVGVVSMTFHFSESPTNVLTNLALDPAAKTPELKICAVRLEKVRE